MVLKIDQITRKIIESMKIPKEKEDDGIKIFWN